MRIIFSCGVVALYFASQSVAATETKVVDSYTTTESTGETLLHRTIQLPNLDTNEPEIYMQVLRQNEDGSLSTIPTMTSEKMKKRRKKICAQLGGTDVTDEGVARITPGMIEFYQCDLPTQKDGESILKQGGDSSRPDSSNEKALAAGSAVITQIDGTGITYSYPGATILQTAAYEVSYFGGSTTVQYAIQSDACNYSGQQFYSGPSGSARRAWGGRCLILRNTPPGAIETLAQACPSNGSCDGATGAIIVEE